MTQEQALEILKLGHNVFLTGSAGSGKTFLLGKYINFLRDKHVEVGVTAPTGIAATHLEGITIHSWSGIGIKKDLSEEDIEEILRKKYLWKRFKTTKVLIIDEVSMLHSYCLDMVDQVCRAFKRNSLPFGGLQVVLCGDFFQLPPVSREEGGTSFVNKSSAWQAMNIKICYLDEQHRQTDHKFLGILNAIRKNKVDESALNILMQRYNQPIKSSVAVSKLYTHNVNVDAINNLKLEGIRAKKRKYLMHSSGRKNLVKALKKGCLAPAELILKKGAIVMFVKNNFGEGYVNGTLGKVIGFKKNNKKYPIVETYTGRRIRVRPESWSIEENDRVVAKISQVPLRLAWAITIHKSQGMSLDAAEIDLSKAFVHGMGYVALSRVRTLEGINLLGLNNMALEVDKDVVELDKGFVEFSEITKQGLKKMSELDREGAQKDFLHSIS